jgi:hypothetical protein
MDANGFALALVLMALGWYLGYWAVRLGVRHALADHDARHATLAVPDFSADDQA